MIWEGNDKKKYVETFYVKLSFIKYKETKTIKHDYQIIVEGKWNEIEHTRLSFCGYLTHLF